MPDRRSPPILRVARITPKPGRESDLEQLLVTELAHRLDHVDGAMSRHVGRPIDYQSKDFIVATVWRDKDAMRAFMGASASPPALAGADGPAEAVAVEMFEVVSPEE
jgi:heme-degrading monooxygenase HmoA